MAERDIDGEGLSVHVMRALGTNLISSAVAIKFAELLLSDRYGKAELMRQLPLQATLLDDRWIIIGCEQQYSGQRGRDGNLGYGRVRICISQIDGRVIDFTFVEAFPSSASQGSYTASNRIPPA